MRLLDYDPFTGVSSYFHKDPITGKITIQDSQDIEQIVDVNKQEGESFDKKRSWWKIGTIPNVIVLQWSKECGHPPYSKEWQEYAKKQLNLPDYRKFNVNKVKL